MITNNTPSHNNSTAITYFWYQLHVQQTLISELYAGWNIQKQRGLKCAYLMTRHANHVAVLYVARQSIRYMADRHFRTVGSFYHGTSAIWFLTHWGRLTQTSGSKLGHHWFTPWLVAYSAPSHYLNQWWKFVNSNLTNNIQWNHMRNSNIFVQENAFQNVVCEMAAMLSRPHCVKCIINTMMFLCTSSW